MIFTFSISTKSSRAKTESQYAHSSWRFSRAQSRAVLPPPSVVFACTSAPAARSSLTQNKLFGKTRVRPCFFLLGHRVGRDRGFVRSTIWFFEAHTYIQHPPPHVLFSYFSEQLFALFLGPNLSNLFNALKAIFFLDCNSRLWYKITKGPEVGPRNQKKVSKNNDFIY